MKLESSFVHFGPVADKALSCCKFGELVKTSNICFCCDNYHYDEKCAISALREWMAQIGEVKSVAVALHWKIKNYRQNVMIGFYY